MVRRLASSVGRAVARRILQGPLVPAFDPVVRDAALTLAAMRRRQPLRSAARMAALYAGPSRDADRACLLLGHRGAMARAPENTLGAFQAAMDDGADGIELDVQLSADAVPIVLHDDTLDRTSNLRGPPLRYAADELDAADAGTWFHGWRSEKVPRLDEVFRTLPAGAVINVELKGPTPHDLGLERRVLAVVRAHPHARVIISSFHPAQLLAVRRLAPEMPVGLLLSETSVLPLRTGWATPVLMPDALHPPSSLVDARLVTAAHAAGVRVHVWAVRDGEDARRLIELGVDGLIVDDVAKMREVLRA